jgi:shikimate dehydrogenase
VTGQGKIAAVIGWPIGHSKSPVLHGYWLDRYGLDGAYVPLAVSPENLPLAIRALPRMGFAGANLTVPHKVAVMGLLDRIDANATRIGAVNTLVCAPDGTIEGRNTDGFGFLENLRHGRPRFSAADGRSVVLGAGGAARAIVAALLDDGAPEILLLNRSDSRAAQLARDLGGPIRIGAWADRDAALAGAALLVNTTSLGMKGQPPLALALDALPKTALVSDIVYAPLETPLLAAAKARGNAVADGIGMLLHQARPAFAAWFGRMPEVTPELRRLMAGE